MRLREYLGAMGFYELIDPYNKQRCVVVVNDNKQATVMCAHEHSTLFMLCDGYLDYEAVPIKNVKISYDKPIRSSRRTVKYV
jgi:hypothetical protein